MLYNDVAARSLRGLDFGLSQWKEKIKKVAFHCKDSGEGGEEKDFIM